MHQPPIIFQLVAELAQALADVGRALHPPQGASFLQPMHVRLLQRAA